MGKWFCVGHSPTKRDNSKPCTKCCGYIKEGFK